MLLAGTSGNHRPVQICPQEIVRRRVISKSSKPCRVADHWFSFDNANLCTFQIRCVRAPRSTRSSESRQRKKQYLLASHLPFNVPENAIGSTLNTSENAIGSACDVCSFQLPFQNYNALCTTALFRLFQRNLRDGFACLFSRGFFHFQDGRMIFQNGRRCSRLDTLADDFSRGLCIFRRGRCHDRYDFLNFFESFFVIFCIFEFFIYFCTRFFCLTVSLFDWYSQTNLVELRAIHRSTTPIVLR